MKSKQWSQQVGQKGVNSSEKAVTLTPQECIKAFEDMAAEEAFFDRFFENHSKISITFEELIAEPERVLQQVQQFIGVKPKALLSLLERQNPEPMHQLVSNYQELKVQFEGSKWSEYFE